MPAAAPAPERSDVGSPENPVGEIISISGASCEVRLLPGADPKLLGRVGSLLKIDVGSGWVVGGIREVADSSGGICFHIDLLGEAERDVLTSGRAALSRGVSTYPLPGQPVFGVSDAELDAIFSPGEGTSLSIGTVYPTRAKAVIHADDLLSKHFAVLGSTGTGKSSTVALLIHRLVEQLPNGHILILDPHNEYESAFRDIGVHFDPTTLSLPYWLMNLQEHIEVFIGMREASREVEVDILKRSLLAARKKNNPRLAANRLTVDTPVPYKLSDLIQEIDSQMGRLEKPERHLPFLRLLHKIDELRADERYAFMFSGMLINDTASEIVSRMLRIPSNGKPVSTLDLSGVPADIVDVVVSLLCRIVFDFALWSRKGDSARPLLLVCEEAHRYIPRDKDPRHDAARRVLERISKEGRKYGVSLGLVSQRPSDISESVLSQCGTILAMRMNNHRDAAFVASALPEGSETFLNSISSLKNRECVLCGEGVAVPMRVGLDHLDETLRPSSSDPAFSSSWSSGGQDPALVKTVIDRWRSGKR